MSSYFALKNVVMAHNGCVEQLIAALDVANDDERRLVVTNAAMKIQALARMASRRQRFVFVRRRIVDIQRCFRGYLDRKRVLREKIAKQITFNNAVFDHFAQLIQSRFRGYILRKKHCDFYARKRYIQAVSERSEAIRQEAHALHETQRQLHEAAQRASQLETFQHATKNLHHLLSTASISGVYRPPLSVDGCRTVFGTTVEDDLRATVLLAPTPQRMRKFKPDLPVKDTTPGPSGGVVVMNASTDPAPRAADAERSPARLIPHAPVAHATSLQNSVPYQSEREPASLKKAVDKKLQEAIHKGNGFLTRRTEPLKFQGTINAESQFIERTVLASHKR